MCNKPLDIHSHYRVTDYKRGNVMCKMFKNTQRLQSKKLTSLVGNGPKCIHI